MFSYFLHFVIWDAALEANSNIFASKFIQSQKDCEILFLFQRMFVIYTGVKVMKP